MTHDESKPLIPEELPSPACDFIDLLATPRLARVPGWDRPLAPTARPLPVLTSRPWVRALGPLQMTVQTQGWRFPLPADLPPSSKQSEATVPAGGSARKEDIPEPPEGVPADESTGRAVSTTRVRPPGTMLGLKDRLLYLLQPPLEGMLGKGRMTLPFQPYPYQLQGVAFLMPRAHALIADEMGLGKTVQVILSLRLMFTSGMFKRVLIVCPKPLVINWSRELRMWAPDLPFEVIGGDTETRAAMWKVSNCPVQLVNYEILTRDTDMASADSCRFDLVVLDEAQRIKTHESKANRAVRALKRERSWAMSGTPIENRTEDLVNIFSFVEPGLIPAEADPRLLQDLVRDRIIRRTKEQVASHMPPRVIRDIPLELSTEQRTTYDMAEKDGVVHLNELGDTITVQHVFELVMRLKQVCNFDPRTGASSKMEMLLSEMDEVVSSGNKAIIFSQWVEPLERIAQALAEHNPVLYHGKVPQKDRQTVLDRFRDRSEHRVILMSYGCGSVGLNLQFCNYVFLFDRWWNPAIEDQAINRAHRLGQKAPVFVSRYISAGTIEERIAAVLDKKRTLFNEMIAMNGPPINMGMNEDEIFGLFDLAVRPKRAA